MKSLIDMFNTTYSNITVTNVTSTEITVTGRGRLTASYNELQVTEIDGVDVRAANLVLRTVYSHDSIEFFKNIKFIKNNNNTTVYAIVQLAD